MTIAYGLTWDNIPSPMPVRNSNLSPLPIRNKRFQLSRIGKVHEIRTLYTSQRRNTSISVILDAAKDYLLKQLTILETLHEDWDGFGSPAVSSIAIKNCRSVLNFIRPELFSRIKLLPNEWGGVQLRYKTKNGLVCCDYGDESMSYFVERADEEIKWFSFISYNKNNIDSFVESLFSVR